ncbi:hypothetical protein CKF54_04990 [Psittacicella hinzii]|uniref:PDZ domain-containing protein n=1 Tax=Psittacicella hinzii TaxID=2028575 RepID=A0A3A1Y532_9GAMM|nr:S41 family peptidase [Psittacicella hinzii]RIY32376.1 hypothetical protein CKF54_04990 [Psittacicella hinzii]
MKQNLMKTTVLAVLASLSLFTVAPQTASAVLISSTKSNPIDNNVYLRESVLNNFTLNANILSDSFAPRADQNYPFRQVQGQFAQLHFDRVKINRGSKIGEKVLEYYLQTLDPNKIYFTKQDVDSFYSQYASGSSPKITNDLNTAWVIYKIYLQRVTALNKAQAAYILSVKDKQPNLDTNVVLPRGKDASYRDQSRKSLEEVAQELALVRLISVKLEKTNFNWSQVAAYSIRGLVNFQGVVNRSTSDDVFTTFMNVYVGGGADYHSAFFPAERQKDFNDSLNKTFYGIGVTFRTNTDGSFEIVQVLKGGPSAKQGGIEKGDEILAVSADGRNWNTAEGLTSDKLVRQIRGESGTKVYLRLLSKDGYTKVVSIIRGTVERVDTSAKLKTYNAQGKKYGVLTFGQFYNGVAEDVRKLINNNRNISGLIIDLRANGGGYVEELLKMSELFFGNRSPVFQVTNNSSQIVGNVMLATPYSFGKSEALFTQPVIVLIDGASASASEILSAAFQDYRRGLIVGATSYGKGTVQAPNLISDFSNDGLSLITIQKYFRLTGAATQFNGVTPDIVLPAAPYYQDSERTLFNTLPYSVINETKFVPFTGYVTKNAIEALTSFENNYLETNTVYSTYVDFMQRLKKEQSQKVTYINYSRSLANQNYVQNQTLTRYNTWAKANGKATYATYKDFYNADTTEGPDPNLDLVKQMLVEYAKHVNK